MKRSKFYIIIFIFMTLLSSCSILLPIHHKQKDTLYKLNGTYKNVFLSTEKILKSERSSMDYGLINVRICSGPPFSEILQHSRKAYGGFNCIEGTVNIQKINENIQGVTFNLKEMFYNNYGRVIDQVQLYDEEAFSNIISEILSELNKRKLE